MLNDPADRPMEEDVSTRPATAASPLAEALRRGAALPSARVVVTGTGTPVTFAVGGHRIAPLGDSLEPPLDQLAAALAVPDAGISVTEATDAEVVEALAEASIDLDVALTQAGATAAAWHEILRVVPDDRAVVRLVATLPPGGIDMSDDQWRVLARIAGGRPVGELAQLLELGQLAAMQTVHALAIEGLVTIVAAPRVLAAPPVAAALAPPALPPPGAAPLPAPAPPAGFAPPVAPAAPVPVPVTAEAPSPLTPVGLEPAASPATPVDPGWVDDAPAAADDAWSTAAPAAVVADDEWGETPTEIETTTWDHEPTPTVRTTAPDAGAWGADESAGPALPAEPALPATADLWADEAPAPPPTTPVAGAPAAPVRPPAPRPVAPLAAFDRDAVAPRPADADPPIAPADDFGSSVVGEDELVNRALLFKFLSSMRD